MQIYFYQIERKKILKPMNALDDKKPKSKINWNLKMYLECRRFFFKLNENESCRVLILTFS